MPADVAHRDRANYVDHLGSFPAFQTFEMAADLKSRIDRISEIEFTVPPIPDADQLPGYWGPFRSSRIIGWFDTGI